MKFPCKECICFPICLLSYKLSCKSSKFSGFLKLIKKCSILKEYMTAEMYSVAINKELEFYNFMERIVKNDR